MYLLTVFFKERGFFKILLSVIWMFDDLNIIMNKKYLKNLNKDLFKQLKEKGG